MDKWKTRGGKLEESERRREEERRSETSKSKKKEDAGARKGRKVAIHCVFPSLWLHGSRGLTSRLAKAAGAEHFFGTRRCGAKHISKSKCTTRFGAFLEVAMLKTCTPL